MHLSQIAIVRNKQMQMKEPMEFATLRTKIIIGGAIVLLITAAILLVFREDAPFHLLVPILTLLWILGIIAIGRYIYLIFKK